VRACLWFLDQVAISRSVDGGHNKGRESIARSAYTAALSRTAAATTLWRSSSRGPPARLAEESARGFVTRMFNRFFDWSGAMAWSAGLYINRASSGLPSCATALSLEKGCDGLFCGRLGTSLKVPWFHRHWRGRHLATRLSCAAVVVYRLLGRGRTLVTSTIGRRGFF